MSRHAHEPTPDLVVRLRPIVVGWTLDVEEGDRRTMVELFQEANGTRGPLIFRGASQVQAYVKIFDAAKHLGLKYARDNTGRIRFFGTTKLKKETYGRGTTKGRGQGRKRA